MKRYIRSNDCLTSEVDAASNMSIAQMAKRVHEAKNELAKYDKEKVEYVQECQNEIMRAISDYYDDEHEDPADWPTGPRISQIKNDYWEGALEDGLMTDEEFEDIFDLLDIISLEIAHSQA